MTTWITICDTCKQEGWDAGDMKQTDGEALASLIEAAANGLSDVKTRRVSCLMGCKNACNVAIQGEGKLNYTLGAFTPTTEAASGIVAYAIAHAASETGQVPYRTWPQAVKGHFVTRHPPLPTTE
jgi:predicted metal-binding protein